MTETIKPSRSRFRKILMVAGIVAASLAALLILLVIFINPILKSAIQTLGSRATGTKLTIGSVRLSILKGRLEMTSLAIRNPAGFEAPDAIRFDEFIADLDLSSMLTSRKIVELVELKGLNIDMEYQTRGSNLGLLMQNVDQFVKSITPESQPQPVETQPEQPQKTAASDRIIIQKLVFEQGSLTFASTMLGAQVTLPLIPIDMTDVGANTWGEAFGKVFYNMMNMTTAALKTINAEQALESIGDGMKAVGTGVVDGAKTVGTGVVDGAKTVGHGVSEGVKQIGDGLTQETKEGARAIGNELKKLF